MQKDLGELSSLIKQADVLLNQPVTESSPEFQVWKTQVKRFLEQTYEPCGTEVGSFNDIFFSPLRADVQENEYVSQCKKGIQTAKGNLEIYLKELGKKQNLSNKNGSTNMSLVLTKKNIEKIARDALVPEINNMDLTKVFIVHGHNGEIKQKVARIVEKQGLEAIILDEQVSGGQTIIEKLEYYINEQGVGAAICLFTADDTGKANKEEEQKPRARQNVVFETGLCIGKLGRERIVVIAENGIELPSDMQGVVYINNNWEVKMLKELECMGFKIDLNKMKI